MSQKIDDSDPRVLYTPASAWHRTGSANEYMDTIHFTGNAGANSTLVFNGTGIGVYGTLALKESPAPVTLFYLDDDVDRAQYSAVPPPTADLYMQRWYQSPPLNNGQHTLVVNNFLDGASIYLDYFVVTSPTSPSQSTSNRGSLSPSTTGAIVGGVLGGVIIFLTAIIILLSRSRRRKADGTEMRMRERSTMSSARGLHAIVPFETESFIAPSNVYTQPHHATNESVVMRNPSSSMSHIPPGPFLAPVHKSTASITTGAPSFLRERRLQDYFPRAASSSEARQSTYDAPPGYGT
ncbi:hypothetical protein APHAL10511_007977 [Amanita phalloides]|nr:hypothetical protein APHAL10511_007977 [Amanita phalloides]